MKKHIIIGKPISHSLSPEIHNYWLKKNKIKGLYYKVEPNSEELPNVVNKVKNNYIHGFNVTVPYKQTIIPFLDEISPLAQKTNSVNVVYKKKNKVVGENTDVYGFQTSLEKSKFKVYKKDALIIGAGGVVPSIIMALNNLEVNKVFIMNRTPRKITDIKKYFPKVQEIEWGSIIDTDIYINATSVGLKKDDILKIDFTNINKNKLFYDLIYNPSMTNFLISAKKLGHNILNGEEMLLYQAQKAFEIWHGILPNIDKELINIFKK